MNSRSRRSKAAALFVVSGLVVTGFLAVHLLTPPVEMTRFRNSLIASTGTESDFDWEPTHVPAEFRSESATAPRLFLDATRPIRSQSRNDLDLMLGLVGHLRSKHKKRGPIKSTTVRAYEEIEKSGRGYCADYTQVFNGLAYSAGLPVREWGMSFDRYSGDGHAFSEIYDTAAGKWVFVDPMNGFYVRDAASDMPLSVLEYRQRLLQPDGFSSIRITPIGNAFLFRSARSAFDYYVQGADEFYLWFGNDVFSYDKHEFVQVLGRFSRPAEQMIAILVGIHPRIRILPTNTNGDEIAALKRLKYEVIFSLLALAGFGVAALWQVAQLVLRRRSNKS